MAQFTGNTTAFIEAQQYSQFILANLHDGLLPEGFYRNVTDFAHGTTLNIKVVGTVTLQDVSENDALTYKPIETSTITMSITEYKGDAWYITDVLRQDGSQIEALHAMRGMESTRALQEIFETKFLAQCNAAQTNANANNVNGFAHRVVSAESGNVVSLEHFIRMKLAFDKANVPQVGRIAIVDPVCEATINSLTNIVNVSNNPMFEGLVTTGFAMGHKFIRNIFGWDIYTSNRLYRGSVGDGTTTVADGVANIFMCVSDDSVKPIMSAWRQMPRVESERNKDFQRDEFITTARFGFGTQRIESLGILGTSATNY